TRASRERERPEDANLRSLTLPARPGLVRWLLLALAGNTNLGAEVIAEPIALEIEFRKEGAPAILRSHNGARRRGLVEPGGLLLPGGLAEVLRRRPRHPQPRRLGSGVGLHDQAQLAVGVVVLPLQLRQGLARDLLPGEHRQGVSRPTIVLGA